MAHVTTDPAAVHPLDGEPTVTPAGSVPGIGPPVAADGPWLVTFSAYVTRPPAATSAGPVFSIARLAVGATTTSACAVLSVGSVSVFGVVDTTATFVSVPVRSARATTTTSVLWPWSRRPSSQVIACAAAVQDPCCGVAETKLKPSGRVSTT